MAVVSSVPAMMRPAEPIRYPDISDMASCGEIVVEPVARVIQDMIYVTVGTSVKESKSNLIWTLQNSGGKRVCIVHVHQPAQMIPMMGTKFPASQMKDQEVRAYREIERQNMQKILEDYLRICRQMGIRAEKVQIEMDCIEKGIVELISQHGIRKLVMGAAADKSHSRKMTDIKSKKAIYVREHALVSCHIQFVCKGHLIHTREADLDAVDAQVALPPPRPSTDSERSPLHLRSRSSVAFGQNNRPSLSNPAQDLFRRVRSSKVDKYGGSTTDVTEGISTPSSSRLEAERSADEWDRVSRRSTSGYSSCSSSALGDLPLIQFERTEGSENGSRNSSTLTHLKDRS